jgi:hypothetical protein
MSFAQFLMLCGPVGLMLLAGSHFATKHARTLASIAFVLAAFWFVATCMTVLR